MSRRPARGYWRRCAAVLVALTLGVGGAGVLAAQADDAGTRDAAPRAGVTTGGERVVLDDVDLSAATFDQVAAGADFTLALAHDGTLYAWGANDVGQLGTGTISTQPQRPVKVDMSGALAGKTITQIAAGGQSAAVLASNGRVYTWGSNRDGALGTNRLPAYVPRPEAVLDRGQLSGKTLTRVVVGNDFMVALDSAGRLYSWGANGEGQLGNGTTTSSRFPVTVDMTGIMRDVIVEKIAVGTAHVVALDSIGKLYAWGRNYEGALNNGSTDSSPVPVLVRTNGALVAKRVTDIAATRGASFALAGGRVYAWGSNTYGELGTGSEEPWSYYPLAVDAGGALAGASIVQLSAAQAAVVARDSTGRVYTWGDDTVGQLGVDTHGVFSRVPVSVDRDRFLFGKSIATVVTGGDHDVVLDSAGQVFTWGRGAALGGGSSTGSDVPVPVATHTVLFGTRPGANPVVDVESGTVQVSTPEHPAGEVEVSVSPVAN